MPIEIRELVIRAVVEDTGSGTGPASDTDPETEREILIRACTDRVLRLLRRSQER